ncbi:MAG TPA: hypothetical protein VM029_16945 [Opitutaceae bacterium]|nr:hypothetical protein [Opitutaceae bacterium]
MLHELLALRRVARSFFFRGILVALLPAAALAQSAQITRVVGPSDGAYDRSVSLTFLVSFSAPVLVQGEPRLPLRVGNAQRFATLAPTLGPSGVGVSTLAFQYVPDAADADADGIAVANAIDLNQGTIIAGDATPAQLTFAAPDTRGVNVTMQRPPTPRIVSARAGGAQGQTLVLSGTADADSMVLLTRADIGLIGATIAAPNGAWSFEYADAHVGTLLFSASAESTDGILSMESGLFSVTLLHTAGNESVGGRAGL